MRRLCPPPARAARRAEGACRWCRCRRSLTSLFGGGGGAAVGDGLALKAAAAVTAGLAIGGAGYEGVRHVPWHVQKPSAAAPAKLGVAANAALRPAPTLTRRAGGDSRHAAGHAVKSPNARPKKSDKPRRTGAQTKRIACERPTRAHAPATSPSGPRRVHAQKGEAEAETEAEAEAPPAGWPGRGNPPAAHGKQK